MEVEIGIRTLTGPRLALAQKEKYDGCSGLKGQMTSKVLAANGN